MDKEQCREMDRICVSGNCVIAYFPYVLSKHCVVGEYWGFPLDSTPLFYFFSSPSDAVASVSVFTVILGNITVASNCCGVFYALRWTYKDKDKKKFCSVAYRVKNTALMILLVALLFLPIRGGITVSAMNTGEVYFSSDMKLNHAAVNPFFSIMESLSHQEDFGKQYRFMDGKRQINCLPK